MLIPLHLPRLKRDSGAKPLGVGFYAFCEPQPTEHNCVWIASLFMQQHTNLYQRSIKHGRCHGPVVTAWSWKLDVLNSSGAMEVIETREPGLAKDSCGVLSFCRYSLRLIKYGRSCSLGWAENWLKFALR